ncbi:hypothetical protein HPB52_023762 [Rhipicephalus sanguineus]|uniref:DUF5641 domain-containing protein n=1 Tax=Rhipicephalus sanguineus TaxID=34632 RepID=A0A9D4Q3W4_RHISA|nr:hypothetical protein HPB52_023762 [Rhipicephalus sanguineus]
MISPRRLAALSSSSPERCLRSPRTPCQHRTGLVHAMLQKPYRYPDERAAVICFGAPSRESWHMDLLRTMLQRSLAMPLIASPLFIFYNLKQRAMPSSNQRPSICDVELHIDRRLQTICGNAGRKEYLLLLRSAHEAAPKTPPRLQVGDIVLVHHDSPPITWKMARVTELLPSRDNIARACCLRKFTSSKQAARHKYVGRGSVLQIKEDEGARLTSNCHGRWHAQLVLILRYSQTAGFCFSLRLFVTPHTRDSLKEVWKKLLQMEGRARKRRVAAQMDEILYRMRIIRGAESLTSCTRDYLDSLEVTYTRLLRLYTRRPTTVQDLPDYSTNLDSKEGCGNDSVEITEAKRPDGTIATDPTEIAIIYRNHFLAQFHDTDPSGVDSTTRQINEFCQNLRRPAEEEFQPFVPSNNGTSRCHREHATKLRPRTGGLSARFYAAFLKTVKAFDRVKHRILLDVLHEFGFSGNLIRLPLLTRLAGDERRSAFSLTGADVSLFGRDPPSDFFGKGLLLYWYSTNTKFLEADRHPGPLAELSSPSIRRQQTPIKDQPASIAETITRIQLSADESRKTEIWRRKKANQSRVLPREVHHFIWKKNWKVIPSKLHQFGIVPSARRPNCRAEESAEHALFECAVAKPAHGRNRGTFAKLVVACTLFIIWKRRCLAEATKSPVRAAYPAVSHIRWLLWSHLTEELNAGGEQKLLRR